ncbi:MFS transporter [Actinoplanes italicus]|uniref:DHA2 family lincomycin resistance protein-like MFS transporter n=1 Tax=Actinoplanes italicus TaxID=113567 RepID=A0A2T0JYL3_9ACTN|nr:DHA2 family efflux MFS transporter permease subunit [Actinoplanes italicus]PRX14619.1 DHA2 family lincomycin resistance protein-like MFS transporter [Actinoplanes italicus]GIE34482.1 MFS transporter [Actinoplanes italicus]
MSTTPKPDIAAPAPTVHSGERLPPGVALVIGVLMVSTFIVFLNEMLLGVALPTLIEDFGVSPSTGQWVTTGFLLTMAVLIPASGFVMRRFHLRTIFLVALSLFIVGTTLAAIAPAFGVLVTGRILQASGTAVFLPLLMTTTMRLVPAGRRGRMMALTTAVPALAPAVGPALSGLVLSALSWRWLFILMLPIAIAALVLGAWKLRNITTPEPVALDLLSLLLSAVGFGGLVYGLSLLGEASAGHTPVSPYVPVAVGLAGLVAFVLRQISLQRRDSAFLDMRIFLRKSFTLPLLMMVFVAGNGIGLLVVLPLVLTHVTGLSTLQLGLFLLPGGAAISIVVALSGRVYDGLGPRPLVIPAAIVWLAVLWFFSQINETTSVVTLIVAWLVFTSAQAAMWAPLTTSAMDGLRTEFLPHGSAAFSTVQQLAGAAFGAVFISAYTIGSGARDAGVLSTARATSAGHAAFLTAWAIGLLVLVGVFFIRRTPSPAADATAVAVPVSGETAADAPAVDAAVGETVAR